MCTKAKNPGFLKFFLHSAARLLRGRSVWKKNPSNLGGKCRNSQSWIFFHSRPENLEKSRQKTREKKNIFSWNCISGRFKLFSSSKIDFWSFWKLQKMKFGQKIFSWNFFFDFPSFFFGLDFFKFSGPLCNDTSKYYPERNQS